MYLALQRSLPCSRRLRLRVQIFQAWYWHVIYIGYIQTYLNNWHTHYSLLSWRSEFRTSLYLFLDNYIYQEAETCRLIFKLFFYHSTFKTILFMCVYPHPVCQNTFFKTIHNVLRLTRPIRHEYIMTRNLHFRYNSRSVVFQIHLHRETLHDKSKQHDVRIPYTTENVLLCTQYKYTVG